MRKTDLIEIDGKYFPSTIEVEENTIVEIIPYNQRVIARIREKYSIDDEIAILRQRETKPEEFAEYNAFVEQIKSEEKYR